ncbi:response regulator transcription factor [Steroidobacter sp. S1-65]|uniref:Response regulator transcription factor n=1 Tax=Steroidobacter gossypii TaxID=2805490 RepID=A0ABS1WWN5_9GAMM|nr:response regulator transcription factor [Steroidobacter gossypii]MBM0105391.1 response regulator transcription factor [Steroidobacter gossypii]
MQSFEQEMKSLRRAIRHFFERIGWRSAPPSKPVAPEVSSPPDLVSSILDRTATDLRQLATSGEQEFDARLIIERAVRELSQLGYQSPPFEEQLMDRYLATLPKPDHDILCLFKEGKKHNEIAALMNTDLRSVRASLIKTYADLRMNMIGPDDGGGGLPTEAPATAPPTSTSTHKPMKRSLLHHV